MPKTKKPIVPVRKPVDQTSVPKQSQTHTRRQKTTSAKPTGAGSNYRVGGGHGKRPREGDDLLNAKNIGVKRRNSHGGDGGSWRGRDGDSGAGSGQWRPLSIVHQQSAFAVQRLLEADSSRKHGASLKSLTLAPHVEAKKATFAVTCQVLKFSQILEQLAERAELTLGQPKLGKYVAMVLSYELLRGQGLARKGPAERAVLVAEARLRAALDTLLGEEGAQSLDELLAARQKGGVGASGEGRRGGGGGGGGPDVPHPRWVRVNTLKADVDEVVRQLEKHLRATEGSKAKKQQAPGDEASGSAAGGAVVRDAQLPGELLALPPGTDLHDHPLVTRGSVVLQSKASCMPARALAPQPGWTVVDCCAAPGNKTTHLAAIMGNKGRVLAFDKNPRRLARLRSNAALTGSSCIEARLADFLSIDPTDPEFREVRGVLLDPSCSGSGTTFTRMDHLLPSHHHHHNNKYNNNKNNHPNSAGTLTGQPTVAAEQLADAEGTPVAAAAAASAGTSSAPSGGPKQQRQQPKKKKKGGQQQQREEEEGQCGGGGGSATCPDSAPVTTPLPVQDSTLPDPDPNEAARVAQLARFQAAALSHALRFPNLERLVYSTCSVHVEENEAVVAGALTQAEEAGLELADPYPSWHRRGLPLFPGAEKLVRTDAYQDGTDGFFVALFQRRRPQAGDQQQEQGQEEGEQGAATAKRQRNQQREQLRSGQGSTVKKAKRS